MERNQRSQEGRRGFLKIASVGTVAGAATALVGQSEAEAARSEDEKAGSGYRETAHVRKVYDLSRF